MQGRASTLSAAAPASATATFRGPRSDAGSKRDRQLAIRDLVASESIGSQQELADRLTDRGFVVTQATVSRDIAELGLVKMPRAGGHAYVVAEALAGSASTGSAGSPVVPATDDRLRRILADIPVTVGRSGLILHVTGSPGTASVIGQAIDESTALTGQEGTLAGDNTLLVLFADEARLLAWRQRFDRIRSAAGAVPEPTALEGSPA
jgi:transcriptional regulator of arginine metabolism